MDYPFPILRVSGGDALSTLERLRAKASGTPLILGDHERFERVAENRSMNDKHTTEELLALSLSIDPVTWFTHREAADPDHYDIDHVAWSDEISANTGLSAHVDVLTRKPYSEVILTELPTTASWEAPCYLRIGNWNDVPAPEEHAALFKYWQERYGAVIACMADDTFEFTVSRPPTTQREALALAREHFIYCADIVHQGVGSLEGLAAVLLRAPVWYFWWD